MSHQKQNILICHPERDIAKALCLFLKTNNYDSAFVTKGKDCQKAIYKSGYNVILLDFNTQDYFSLEVLKYAQLNFPDIKIIMSFSSKKILSEYDLTIPSVKKLGISECYFGALEGRKLLKMIEGLDGSIKYDQIEISHETSKTVDIKANDSDFSRVALKNLFQGKIVIFDYYLRKSQGLYTKLFNTGEHFDPQKIKDTDPSAEYIYFKISDRTVYISHMNKVLHKIIGSRKVSTEKKVATTKNLIEKYVEEIYVTGIALPMYKEAVSICDSVFDLIKKERGLHAILNNLEDSDPSKLSHIFLVSLLCATTCNNLKWATPRTMKIVTMGAMLHEIGKIKIEPRLASINWVDDLRGPDFKKYSEHPILGTEMLQQFPSISEPVRQVVFQHQEYINGEGFPNGLTGLRMYPPAKIVSLVNFFVRLMRKDQLTPKEALTVFISEQRYYSRFDADVIKALIQSFIRQKL